MNTLSITTIKTMSYDADAAVQSFAIVEKLVSVTGALLKSARRFTAGFGVPAFRAAQA